MRCLDNWNKQIIDIDLEAVSGTGIHISAGFDVFRIILAGTIHPFGYTLVRAHSIGEGILGWKELIGTVCTPYNRFIF